jgi:Tfp pilus assembly protein PilX
MTSTFVRQRGATLTSAMIMLELRTLFVLAAIIMSCVNF